ncbi:MAG: ABC transporter substrate-binding protein [Rhodobacteraceae bacterium]|nr:ABC transporter substrate-binding protein [Paracoccaceae bacterium]
MPFSVSAPCARTRPPTNSGEPPVLNAFARLLSGILLAVALISPAAAETITIKDAYDREVEVPANPDRILLGFYFEDFFAVGGEDAYDRVVAISRSPWEGWRGLQWKAYVKAVPRIDTIADVGEVDSGTFSLEAALAAKPQVAILAGWQYNALGDGVQRLEAAGIPVVVLDFNAQTVEKHVASTLALGQILGAEDRASELAMSYKAAVEDVTKRLEGVTARPKVYVELARKGADEVDNSYGNTMWGRLIETAGGTNIAATEIEKWGPLSPEYVLAQTPEVIFLAGSGWLGRDKAVIMGPGIDSSLSHDRMQPYTHRAGWGGLSAVQDGNIHAIYHGGARTLYDYVFLQYLAKALHPELFADVDPEANLEAFFAKYMPIQFKGTYMTRLPDPANG